jgi:gliding motility-associated-like protein
MTKKLLLVAFILTFLGIKAQTPEEKKLLLQGFDEVKAKKELTLHHLNADENIDRVRRNYMAKRVKELGLIKQQNLPTNTATNQTTAKNGNSHNTVLSSACANSSFQQLNFNGWSGVTGDVNAAATWTLAPSYTLGTVSYAPQLINSPLIEGQGGPGTTLYDQNFNQIPTTNRHNIMNAPPANNNPSSTSFSGYDSLAINPTTHLSDIPFVSPNGSGTSVRLGNANGGAETESITYSISVTSSTSLFTYQYAVILNNPQGHSPDEEPYFNITTVDQYGHQIDSTTSCGSYTVNTDAAATDSTFTENTGDQYNGLADVFYKKWTSVSVDLTHYIGQTVTITFQTFDCSLGGHFGYAYIDAFCGNPGSASSVLGFCGTTRGSVSLVAPPGFTSYQWYGPSPNNSTLATGTGVNTQTLSTTASINDTFTVKTVSPSGCPSSFKIVVKPSNIVLNLSSNATCKGGANGSVAAVAAGTGSFNYNWTGPLGGLGTNTVVTNLPTGSYSVHVVDNTGLCPPRDTVVQVVSVNPTIQNSTMPFCGSQAALIAPAGSSYQWYDNSNTLTSVTTQTNVASNTSNGQHYTVIYKDPTTQCEDSLKITLTQAHLVFDTLTSHPCSGGNNGSITYTNANPTGIYNSYNWVVSGGVNNSGTTSASSPINISNLGIGTYTMIISVPGNPTCNDTIKNNLIANNGVVIPNRDSTHAVCNMDTLTINSVNPNVTNSWTGPGAPYGVNTLATFTIAPVFTNTVSGFYTYTDSMHTPLPGNCLSVTEYVIKIKSFKASGISVVEPLKCFHDSTAKIKVSVVSEKNGPINSPDKYTYTWSSNNTINSLNPNPTYGNFPSSSSISYLKAGTYTCEIKNGNCVDEVSYTLQDGPRLTNDNIYAYYCPKDSLALLIADTGNTNYVWHPSNSGVSSTGDSIHVLVQNVNSYYVTYKHNGCPDTGKVIITTTPNAFIPNEMVNVFSPNGDKSNDLFYPFYSSSLNQYQIGKQSNDTYYELTIYDRWGILVYNATDYNKPWDGKTKSGHDADNGTYFYIVKYKSNCSSASLEEKKGFVELIR